MHATRRAILDLLLQHDGGTARDLADWLEVKLPSLRYHLLALEDLSLIERMSQERSGHVGRPAIHYRLTPQGIHETRHCTPWLVKGLLGQFRTHATPEQISDAFRGLGQRFAQEFAPDPADFPSLDERLHEVSHALSQRGYGAAIEVQTRGEQREFVIQTRVCPFGDLPQEHAELCLMDQALVSELVGQPCTQDMSMASGDSCCSFHLSSPAAISLDPC